VWAAPEGAQIDTHRSIAVVHAAARADGATVRVVPCIVVPSEVEKGELSCCVPSTVLCFQNTEKPRRAETYGETGPVLNWICGPVATGKSIGVLGVRREAGSSAGHARDIQSTTGLAGGLVGAAPVVTARVETDSVPRPDPQARRVPRLVGLSDLSERFVTAFAVRS